jgi:hypothetical protein
MPSKKKSRSGYKYQNTQLDKMDAQERRERGLPPAKKKKGKRKKK